MKYRLILGSVAGACAIVASLAAQPKLPVVSVAYDGAVGSTETEEETLEDSSYRHQATLKVREEWSRAVVSTLVGDFTRKLYVEGSGTSYSAFQISPQLRWSVTDLVRWDASMLV